MLRNGTFEQNVYTLFDASRQIKIGIFTSTFAAKFIYGAKTVRYCINLSTYATKKGRVQPKSSRLSFPCSVRFSGECDQEILGGQLFVLLNEDYRDLVKGFENTYARA